MTLFRTVEPAVEPVTLAEAKANLRISHDSEDALISGLIRAARDDVERTAGLALIDQSWRLTLDAWPPSGTVRIRRHPAKEILAITAYGSDGEAWVVNPADYLLDARSRPARLHLEKRPERLRTINGIEIDFRAGFGEAGPDVPDLLKRAMLTLVAHWYEFRVHVAPDQQPVSYPPVYERLIDGYRMRRL